MLNESFIVNTDDIKDVVRVFDSNFSVFAGDINSNQKAITNLSKAKASRIGVCIAIVVGILYVIKNEIDKDDINTALIKMDKVDLRRCCSELESEGEAIEPANI